MNEYKEFQGKTLDDAIQNACDFYGVSREKLEVEIISDAKGGIFGLVGSRKANIRARRTDFGTLFGVFEQHAASKQPHARPDVLDAGEPARMGPEQKPEHFHESAGESRDMHSQKSRHGRKNFDDRQCAEKDVPRSEQHAGRQDAAASAICISAPPAADDTLLKPVDFEAHDDLPKVPFEQLEKEDVQAITRDVVQRLVSSLVENAVYEVTCSHDRVYVSIATDDDPGLIIGRDGQTLASVQYLATRLVSNKMRALVRVQVDIADYRHRQDERLRELALALAEKVKQSGKPQLSRPLASYHRRVIHVTLHDDPLIQTHSKGEGELKRVVVALRRKPQHKDDA